MNEIAPERQAALLENVLDALDRLFDRDSSAWDIRALLVATSEALRGTTHSAEIERALEGLSPIRASAPKEDQRDQALTATDQLRHYLADLLP